MHTPISPLLLLLVALFLLTSCTATPGSRAGQPGSVPPLAEQGPDMRIESIEVAGRAGRYALFIPAGYDRERRWPLVLFLHGSGESGDNGTRQLTIGLPRHLLWDSAEWPCFVLMPQKASRDAQWDDDAPVILAMLDRIEREYSIDPDRVVLTGLSQGGHGCWSINAAAPGRFAALAPVCGYGAPPPGWEAADRAAWRFDANNPETHRLIEAARSVPSWIFHGEADTVVPPDQSTGMHAALRAAGANVRIDTYPGIGHDSWDKAYSNPALRAWLLAARRP